MEIIQAGDVVISVSGRDKGEHLLAIKTEGGAVYLVNGKSRKVSSPKKKNVKHVKTVKKAVFTELAEEIASGTPVSDKRVWRLINSVIEK
jgi:ribosomal protein L14E/L6E/L27E